MDLFLNDERIPILYEAIYKEYKMPLFYKNKIEGMQHLFFCPWCGVKLPKSLRHEWINILENEYHINNPMRDEQAELIPIEFKTKEWWVKRGL